MARLIALVFSWYFAFLRGAEARWNLDCGLCYTPPFHAPREKQYSKPALHESTREVSNPHSI